MMAGTPTRLGLLAWVIVRFLEKIPNERRLVMDGLTDRPNDEPIDRRTHPLIENRGRI